MNDREATIRSMRTSLDSISALLASYTEGNATRARQLFTSFDRRVPKLKTMSRFAPLVSFGAGFLIEACLDYLKANIIKWAETVDGLSDRCDERAAEFIGVLDSVEQMALGRQPVKAGVSADLTRSMAALVREYETGADALVNLTRRMDKFERMNRQMESGLKCVRMLEPHVQSVAKKLRELEVERTWRGTLQ
jgi:hypothetical protein